MNKQELIFELTRELDPNADKFYTSAIIKAIQLVHKLVEYYPPTAGGTIEADPLLRYSPAIQTTIILIRKYFKIKLHEIYESDIAELINSKQSLMAVKRYKQESGLGLKEAKQDIDKVRVSLGLISEGDYANIWGR